MLLALGYTDLDEEHYAFVGHYFAVLSHGAYLVDEASMEMKILTMPEEERKKHELILQNRREYMAKMKKDAEYKKHLEELSQKERKVKQQEKATTAKANELKFGANVIKFEPPANKGG